MLLSYTLSTLWHERARFLSGMLAVAFSAALIALQTGLLLGMFATTSAPIDHTSADIWVGAPSILSVDLGRPIGEDHIARLASQSAVETPEPLLLDYAYWIKDNGSKELCIVVGSRLAAGALGAVEQLTPGIRARLSEPGAVAIDLSEMSRLDVHGVNQFAQVNGKRVRVVGLTRGIKSLTGPYIFCSMETARPLVHAGPDQTTYLLARCADPAAAPRVVEKLRSRYPDLSAFTKEEFSLRTRLHWLIMTNAGIATGFTAILGLIIGAVITSQTLYAATIASLREFAVLRALGIPRYKIALAVLSQSLGVGLIGVLAAGPVIFTLARGAMSMGTEMFLPWWLLAGTGVLTVLTALLSGLAALRSLRELEPATLLH